MEQPINQLSSSSNNNFPLIPIIASIILTIVVVGGGIFWWMNQKQQELNNEIISLRNQNNSQSDELVEAKFKLAVRDLWDVREVFRNPQNKNQFYYISGDSSGEYIWVYDLVKDKTYQSSGYFNIPEGNTLLLSQKLAQYKEFRGVGFSDNKFVFAETSTDSSPGPCSSPWFYPNLQYIDMGVANPTRKSFTLPDDLKRSEEQKIADCQKSL